MGGPRDSSFGGPRLEFDWAGLRALSIDTMGRLKIPLGCPFIWLSTTQWRIPILASFSMTPGCLRLTTGQTISEPPDWVLRWYVSLCWSSPCLDGYAALHRLHLNTFVIQEILSNNLTLYNIRYSGLTTIPTLCYPDFNLETKSSKTKEVEIGYRWENR